MTPLISGDWGRRLLASIDAEGGHFERHQSLWTSHENSVNILTVLYRQLQRLCEKALFSNFVGEECLPFPLSLHSGLWIVCITSCATSSDRYFYLVVCNNLCSVASYYFCLLFFWQIKCLIWGDICTHAWCSNTFVTLMCEVYF